MAYKVFYFPGRGRVEHIRVLLHEVDQPFENVVVKRDELMEMKKQGPATLPFGALPIIHDDDVVLAQSNVILGYLGRKHGLAPSDPISLARADALCFGAEDMRSKYFGVFGDDSETKMAEFVETLWRGRWLPNFAGLLELNGNTGYFVGDSFTYADIAVWDALDGVLRYVTHASLDGFPTLQSFYDSVGARPRIKAYVDSRTD